MDRLLLGSLKAKEDELLKRARMFQREQHALISAGRDPKRFGDIERELEEKIWPALDAVRAEIKALETQETQEAKHAGTAKTVLLDALGDFARAAAEATSESSVSYAELSGAEDALVEAIDQLVHFRIREALAEVTLKQKAEALEIPIESAIRRLFICGGCSTDANAEPKEILSDGAGAAATCPGCGGLIGWVKTHDDLRNFVDVGNWAAGSDDTRYFDLSILETRNRTHGWMDRESRRMVQAG